MLWLLHVSLIRIRNIYWKLVKLVFGFFFSFFFSCFFLVPFIFIFLSGKLPFFNVWIISYISCPTMTLCWPICKETEGLKLIRAVVKSKKTKEIPVVANHIVFGLFLNAFAGMSRVSERVLHATAQWMSLCSPPR